MGISIRDPSLYLGRMAVFFIANTLMALVYWNARPYKQQFVLPKFALMGWLGAVPTVFSAVTVFAFNNHFKLLSKEVKGGLVSAHSYVLATFSLETPYMFLLAVSAMAFPVYVIAGCNTSGLPGTIMIMAAALWCFESIAQCCGVLFHRAIPGMLAILGFWIFCFLFAGPFLKREFLPWPCNQFVDFLPLSYTFRTLHYLQFQGTVWSDARETTEFPGFACEALGPCFGHTGDNVLEAIGSFFNSSSQNTIVFDTYAVLVIGVSFKLICHLVILHQTTHIRGSWRGRFSKLWSSSDTCDTLESAEV